MAEASTDVTSTPTATPTGGPTAGPSAAPSSFSERADRGAGTPPRRPSPWLLGAVATVVAALLAVVLVAKGSTGSGGSAPAGLANFSSTPAGNLLQLDVLARGNWYKPADFRLTDQRGQAVSPRQFLGKSVVLTFNDDRCVDLCTLLAQDLVLADGYLGAEAKHVAFLSVNVNPFYPEVRYVKAWSTEHGLGGLGNWYFGTATPQYLKGVWHHYGVYVGLDQKARSVVHSAEIFFINPAGHVVGIGQFGNNAANTSLFAHSMAQFAVAMLPAGERAKVGGPPVPSPTSTNATVGAPAPAFNLPLLGDSQKTLSSSQLSGKYAVLNFWASTCTACKQEMPSIEAAYRDLGSKVAFVGVDVSDPPSAGAAFAKRFGVTYPLVSDRTGALSGAYRIPGLPFSAIVGPHGDVLVRHPGTFTAEQLEYVVKAYALGGGAPGSGSG